MGSRMGTGVLVVLLCAIFFGAVLWFRSKPKQAIEDRVESIADVLTPDPINQAVIAGAINTQAEDASIHLLHSAQSVGAAKRGKKDEAYYLEMKTTLPEIDREVFYYEAWLLQPIPYDFFPVGEMMTDEEGDFILTWQAPDRDNNYLMYDRIVITRQERKGSTDPNVKVAEGAFGVN